MYQALPFCILCLSQIPTCRNCGSVFCIFLLNPLVTFLVKYFVFLLCSSIVPYCVYCGYVFCILLCPFVVMYFVLYCVLVVMSFFFLHIFVVRFFTSHEISCTNKFIQGLLH